MFVWIVDKTKCPVIDALTAILAVSVSRISPTIIILGSWRKIERSAVANVSPISLFVWIWFTPSIFISTGSSTVIILTSSLFSLCKIEYTVVDLPLPVAPVTKIIPLGELIILITFS